MATFITTAVRTSNPRYSQFPQKGEREGEVGMIMKMNRYNQIAV
jgi:hypothetical protein